MHLNLTDAWDTRNTKIHPILNDAWDIRNREMHLILNDALDIVLFLIRIVLNAQVCLTTYWNLGSYSGRCLQIQKPSKYRHLKHRIKLYVTSLYLYMALKT